MRVRHRVESPVTQIHTRAGSPTFTNPRYLYPQEATSIARHTHDRDIDTSISSQDKEELDKAQIAAASYCRANFNFRGSQGAIQTHSVLKTHTL